MLPFLHKRHIELSSPARRLDYAGAVGIVAATVGVAFLVNRVLPYSNLSLLFLTGVLLVSARTGLGPSLLASILCFLALNFFFTPPYYTFQVANKGDVETLFFFLFIAGITGNLAARMHREMAERRASLQRISNLYDFSRQVTSAAGTDEVLNALANHLQQSLSRPVVVYIAIDGGAPVAKVTAGPPVTLPDIVAEAAWLQAHEEPINMDLWYFLKLITKGRQFGMVAIHGGYMDKEQINMVGNLCDQAAVALHRTKLAADLEQARLDSETERLRSALLSSVSHDLRTPLASIIGSTTSLLEYGKSFSENDRRDLLETIVEEAQRLDRHIQNLLDMTRLGQGNLRLRRDWVDVNDIVSGAVDRLRTSLKGLTVEIDISRDVPLLWVHGLLIEQALVNLLDNAIHFSPDNGTIVITSRQEEDNIVIEVCDEGPGIPVNEREKIFDMFYTMHQGDRGKLQGTGLGLAICRGLVGAHGGSVTAQDGREGRGTCMHIVLPVIQPPGKNES